MLHKIRLKIISANLISIILSQSVLPETIPAVNMRNYKIDNRFTINGMPDILEKTWQDVCRKLDFDINETSGRACCINHVGNPVFVQPGDLCADNSFKVPADVHLCENPVPLCPNSSWTLSEDNKTCFRPDFSCIIRPDIVSEEKLLAAIAYGESSILDNYEEIAAIANAVVRRRDAAQKLSVAALVKAYPKFSYALTDGNERFRKLMCSDVENGFEKAYRAAINALNHGIDYANGECFWDGYDLKTSGEHHPKYRDGFIFTASKHNIFFIQEPVPHEKITKSGTYDHVYDSTAAYGGTIFWKLSKDFLKAREARQCL